MDPEARAGSVAKYESEAGWGPRSESGSGCELRKSDSVRAKNLTWNPSCESRILSERRSGRGTELRADAESGVGVDPEAHADSAVKYDAEAGGVACSESGTESELRKSDSARARNPARYPMRSRAWT